MEEINYALGTAFSLACHALLGAPVGCYANPNYFCLLLFLLLNGFLHTEPMIQLQEWLKPSENEDQRHSARTSSWASSKASAMGIILGFTLSFWLR